MDALNLDTISNEMYDKLSAMDAENIGTDHYMGIRWFGWNMEYKHYLRDCSSWQRKCVHDLFCEEGLALDGVSDHHEEIIFSCLGLND